MTAFLSDEERESDLLNAVIADDLEEVIFLLDFSPELYKIFDEHGHGLLHLAILNTSERVFDHLISIDIPLETKDNRGLTPLETALCKHAYTTKSPPPASARRLLYYFAYKLIKRGANIHHPILLHCACSLRFVKVVNLLLDSGLDPNETDDEGNAPLHISCTFDSADAAEITLMLLCAGADALLLDSYGRLPIDLFLEMREGIPTLSLVIASEKLLFENLFLHTFDKFGKRDMSLNTFLAFTEIKSSLFEPGHPIFDRFINRVTIFNHDGGTSLLVSKLLKLDWKYLGVLIDKFPDVVKKEILRGGGLVLRRGADAYSQCFNTFSKLLESQVKDETITYISNLASTGVIADFLERTSQAALTEIICYLLSYGMEVTDECLEMVYEKYGFCELFKLFLHMDFDYEWRLPIRYSVCRLIFDVRVDFDNLDTDVDLEDFGDLEDLLKRTAHPRLKTFCLNVRYYDDEDENLRVKVLALPKVPLLTDLARGVFRKYFIRRCDIQNAKQFHDSLKRLFIPSVLKKIITYEAVLYP